MICSPILDLDPTRRIRGNAPRGISWRLPFLPQHPWDSSQLTATALFGYFADNCRLRRLPFILGLIALGASTGLFVIARSLSILIIARALQGLSAAAVWVVGLAIIAGNVPPARVGEVMGHATIAMTWGFLFGPMIGGVMYEKLGFYGTFVVPAVLIAVDVVLRFAMIEGPGKSRLPVIGMMRLTIGDGVGLQQSDKPSPVSQDSTAQVATYSTFRRGEDLDPGYSSDTGDVTGETAPLLAASNAYVEDWAASTDRKATILDLLRSPRLPLALGATVVMAVVFSALETVCPDTNSI